MNNTPNKLTTGKKILLVIDILLIVAALVFGVLELLEIWQGGRALSLILFGVVWLSLVHFHWKKSHWPAIFMLCLGILAVVVVVIGLILLA